MKVSPWCCDELQTGQREVRCSIDASSKVSAIDVSAEFRYYSVLMRTDDGTYECGEGNCFEYNRFITLSFTFKF
jgi:hypothetical protein